MGWLFACSSTTPIAGRSRATSPSSTNTAGAATAPPPPIAGCAASAASIRGSCSPIAGALPCPEEPPCRISGPTSATPCAASPACRRSRATIVLTVGVALGATVAAIVVTRAVVVARCPTPMPIGCTGSTPTTRRTSSRSRSSTTAPSRPDHPAFTRDRGLPAPAGHRGGRRRRGARPGQGRDRLVLPAARPHAADRAPLRCLPTTPVTIGSSCCRTATGSGASAAIRRCWAGR